MTCGELQNVSLHVGCLIYSDLSRVSLMLFVQESAGSMVRYGLALFGSLCNVPWLCTHMDARIPHLVMNVWCVFVTFIHIYILYMYHHVSVYVIYIIVHLLCTRYYYYIYIHIQVGGFMFQPHLGWSRYSHPGVDRIRDVQMYPFTVRILLNRSYSTIGFIV